MKSFVNKFIVLSFICMMLNSYSYGSGWYNNFTITELRYTIAAPDTLVHIQYSTGSSGQVNPDNCVNDHSFIIPVTNSPAKDSAMLSALMSAFAMKKNVKVFLDGCLNGIGGSSYPKIHFLYVLD